MRFSWSFLQFFFHRVFSGFLKVNFAGFVIVFCITIMGFYGFCMVFKFFRERKDGTFNPDSQLQNHPMKKNGVRLGNQTISVPIFGLMILRFRMLVLYKVFFCMDGGNSIESFQSINTRRTGSWLHKVDWIKNGNRKI